MDKHEIKVDEMLARATRLTTLLENPLLVQVDYVISELRNVIKSIRKQGPKCGFSDSEIRESLQDFIPKIPKWNPHRKKKNPQWKTKWNC